MSLNFNLVLENFVVTATGFDGEVVWVTEKVEIARIT